MSVYTSSALACLVAALAVMRCAAYPLGRYGRSMAWAPLPLYYQRSTRPLYYPESEYLYPQPQEYYYPPLPGYYMDQQQPYYYSYSDAVADPTGEMQDIQQDEGLRGEYGQETWFQDNQDDPNSKFLEDLILNQMYDGKVPEEEGDKRQRWVYGEQVKSARPKSKAKTPSSKEDEDVRELKSLVRGPTERRDKQLKYRVGVEDPFEAQMRPKSNNWDVYRSNNKRSGGGIEISQKAKTMTTTPPSFLDRGQKEVVAPRPAVTRTHEPSVYDTIKKLLHMEDLAQGAPRLQKRSFVDNEDSLVGQLGHLKDMS